MITSQKYITFSILNSSVNLLDREISHSDFEFLMEQSRKLANWDSQWCCVLSQSDILAIIPEYRKLEEHCKNSCYPDIIKNGIRWDLYNA